MYDTLGAKRHFPRRTTFSKSNRVQETEGTQSRHVVLIFHASDPLLSHLRTQALLCAAKLECKEGNSISHLCQ